MDRQSNGPTDGPTKGCTDKFQKALNMKDAVFLKGKTQKATI